jgi:hypothetical protein
MRVNPPRLQTEEIEKLLKKIKIEKLMKITARYSTVYTYLEPVGSLVFSGIHHTRSPKPDLRFFFFYSSTNGSISAVQDGLRQLTAIKS